MIMPTTAIKRAGDLLVDAAQPDDQWPGRSATRRASESWSRRRDALQRIAELLERRAAAFADTEQPAELAHGDLDADSGEEADQDAVRQEVGDEAEPDQPRDDEEDART